MEPHREEHLPQVDDALAVQVQLLHGGTTGSE